MADKSRNSRPWQSPLAYQKLFEGDISECQKALGQAQAKLKFMLANHPGTSSTTYIHLPGVTVHIDTRPNRIRISAEGGLLVTMSDWLSAMGAYPDASLPPYQKFVNSFLYSSFPSVQNPKIKSDFYAASSFHLLGSTLPDFLSGYWYDKNEKSAISWRITTIFKGGLFKDIGVGINAAALLDRVFLIGGQYQTKPAIAVLTLNYIHPDYTVAIRYYTFEENLLFPDQLATTLRLTLNFQEPAHDIGAFNSIIFNQAEFTKDGEAIVIRYSTYLSGVPVTQKVKKLVIDKTAPAPSGLVTYTITGSGLFDMLFDKLSTTESAISSGGHNHADIIEYDYDEGSVVSSSTILAQEGGALIVGKIVGGQYYYLYGKLSAPQDTRVYERNSLFTHRFVSPIGWTDLLRSGDMANSQSTSINGQLILGVYDLALSTNNLILQIIDDCVSTGISSGTGSFVKNISGALSFNSVTVLSSLNVTGFYPENNIVIYEKSSVTYDFTNNTTFVPTPPFLNGYMRVLNLTGDYGCSFRSAKNGGEAEIYVLSDQYLADGTLTDTTDDWGIYQTVPSISPDMRVGFSYKPNNAENAKILVFKDAVSQLGTLVFPFSGIYGTIDNFMAKEIFAGVSLSNPLTKFYLTAYDESSPGWEDLKKLRLTTTNQ